jgi:hypothetical protein
MVILADWTVTVTEEYHTFLFTFFSSVFVFEGQHYRACPLGCEQRVMDKPFDVNKVTLAQVIVGFDSSEVGRRVWVEVLGDIVCDDRESTRGRLQAVMNWFQLKFTRW